MRKFNVALKSSDGSVHPPIKAFPKPGPGVVAA